MHVVFVINRHFLSSRSKLYLEVGAAGCGVTGAGLAAGATESGELTDSPEATVLWLTLPSWLTD